MSQTRRRWRDRGRAFYREETRISMLEDSGRSGRARGRAEFRPLPLHLLPPAALFTSPSPIVTLTLQRRVPGAQRTQCMDVDVGSYDPLRSSVICLMTGLPSLPCLSLKPCCLAQSLAFCRYPMLNKCKGI